MALYASIVLLLFAVFPLQAQNIPNAQPPGVSTGSALGASAPAFPSTSTAHAGISAAAYPSVSTHAVVLATTPTHVPAGSTDTPRIQVVWPEPDAKFPFLKRSFTFGNVTPGSTLTINGQAVALEPSGAFFTVVDFATGTFQLSYTAQKAEVSTIVVRSVIVASLDNGVDISSALRPLEPASGLELRVGDILLVRCQGPPGGKGTFRIRRLAKHLPLAERSQGVYEGHYVVQAKDKGRDLWVRFFIRSPSGRKLKTEAPGKLTIADPRVLRVAVTSAPVTVVKSGTSGYNFFLSSGIVLSVTGRKGSLSRISLSEHEEGWVDSDRIFFLPEGTPPPWGQVGKYLSTKLSSSSVHLSMDVEKNLPFEIVHSIEPLTFEIRFYGGIERVDRIRYASEDPVIQEVLWRQESSRVTLLTVKTRLHWSWGYDAWYERGRLIIEIRRPPYLPREKNVLSGRKIVVDPGHAPDRGALGPMGSEEQHLNLAISLKLRDLLVAEGAEVYMTRSSTAGVPLLDRPFLAWQNQGDVFVSVHNNAIAVTDDPFDKARGYMTFYYRPQSRPLAESVHESYRKNIRELADESLHWGDLHVCRMTQMPSILTESAYVIYPQQEALLRDPAYQKKFAQTILEGLRSFYKTYQKIQSASPEELRAARR